MQQHLKENCVQQIQQCLRLTTHTGYIVIHQQHLLYRSDIATFRQTKQTHWLRCYYSEETLGPVITGTGQVLLTMALSFQASQRTLTAG